MYGLWGSEDIRISHDVDAALADARARAGRTRWEEPRFVYMLGWGPYTPWHHNLKRVTQLVETHVRHGGQCRSLTGLGADWIHS